MMIKFLNVQVIDFDLFLNALVSKSIGNLYIKETPYKTFVQCSVVFPCKCVTSFYFFLCMSTLMLSGTPTPPADNSRYALNFTDVNKLLDTDTTPGEDLGEPLIIIKILITHSKHI